MNDHLAEAFTGVERPRPTAQLFADQALFDLLVAAWHSDLDLGAETDDILAYLMDLAGELTSRRSKADSAALEPENAADLAEAAPVLISDPAARALQCLLEHAAARARAAGHMPQQVLGLVAELLPAMAD